jgi:hypothetical protein
MAAFSKKPNDDSPELAALEQRAEEALLRDDEAEYLVIRTEISAFKEKYNLPPSPWASKSSISKKDALAPPGAAQKSGCSRPRSSYPVAASERSAATQRTRMFL